MKDKLSETVSASASPASAHQAGEITVLFADICGSTGLFERYGDVRARQIESKVLTLLANDTQIHQGVVIKTIGDEIMCRFPSAQYGVNAACAMQLGIKDDHELAGLGIAIRIGLHHGPVLMEHDDVFGDAVNVAARMVALAKADQIITTSETIHNLPPNFQQTIRKLGSAWVRGKQNEMEIAEVIWYESGSLTRMSDSETEAVLRNQLYARLSLEYQGQQFSVAPSTQAFTIGRGPRNSLVVESELVSRSHATIEFRQGKFVLRDSSTNGTYVLPNNGAALFVRREEFTLHEQGMICFGQAAFQDNPNVIRYTCKYVD